MWTYSLVLTRSAIIIMLASVYSISDEVIIVHNEVTLMFAMYLNIDIYLGQYSPEWWYCMQMLIRWGTENTPDRQLVSFRCDFCYP